LLRLREQTLMEMRYNVFNGDEMIFTGLTDLPEVAHPEDLLKLQSEARETFRRLYPHVDLVDPRLRHEWVKEYPQQNA
jgi:hypothetical protein